MISATFETPAAPRPAGAKSWASSSAVNPAARAAACDAVLLLHVEGLGHELQRLDQLGSRGVEHPAMGQAIGVVRDLHRPLRHGLHRRSIAQPDCGWAAANRGVAAVAGRFGAAADQAATRWRRGILGNWSGGAERFVGTNARLRSALARGRGARPLAAAVDRLADQIAGEARAGVAESPRIRAAGASSRRAAQIRQRPMRGRLRQANASAQAGEAAAHALGQHQRSRRVRPAVSRWFPSGRGLRPQPAAAASRRQAPQPGRGEAQSRSWAIRGLAHPSGSARQSSQLTYSLQSSTGRQQRQPQTTYAPRNDPQVASIRQSSSGWALWPRLRSSCDEFGRAVRAEDDRRLDALDTLDKLVKVGMIGQRHGVVDPQPPAATPDRSPSR